MRVAYLDDVFMRPTAFRKTYALGTHTAKKPARAKRRSALSEKLKAIWADPVIQEKIALGIENNRKGDFYLNFVDEKTAT